MRKIFTIFKAWSIIYWSIYLINTFYKWSFYNPFWWILELPNSLNIRQNVLIILSFTIMIGGFFYFIVLDKNGKIIKTN